MDFNIRLSNGQILRGLIRSPGEELRAIVMFVHGLGDHIHRYKDLSDFFNREKIGFAGVDLPGHGNSDGKRGHIKSFSLTDEMIGILLNECSNTFPGKPMFLYGHSLGGLIVLDYLIRKNPDIKGAVVTSPWLKLAFKPDRTKVKIASLLKNIVPALTLNSSLICDHLSHDKEVVSKYKNDPLVHDRISISLIHGAFNSAAETLQNASFLKTPVLLMHGSDDLICLPDGSREFASKTKNVELKIWDGGYHELHNELFKHEVYNYLSGWINSRLG